MLVKQSRPFMLGSLFGEVCFSCWVHVQLSGKYCLKALGILFAVAAVDICTSVAVFATHWCAVVGCALQAKRAGVNSLVQTLKLPEVFVHSCCFFACRVVLMGTRLP